MPILAKFSKSNRTAADIRVNRLEIIAFRSSVRALTFFVKFAYLSFNFQFTTLNLSSLVLQLGHSFGL